MTSTTFPVISPALSADLDLLLVREARLKLLERSRQRSPRTNRWIETLRAEVAVLKRRIERSAMEANADA